MTNLRALRQRHKLTLSEAARRIEYDAGNLSRIERGAQQPSLEIARRLAGLYEVTVDEIVGGPIRESA